MKKSNDFYKVVNAVINTLNHGDSVAYVSGGQGGSGLGKFDPDEDFRELRLHLLNDFTTIEDIDVDEDDFGELLNDWAESEDFCHEFDFYEFSTATSRLQVMINPDMYASSYDVRDMICDDYDLEAAEITTGTNGYPRNLRGAVLLNGGDTTINGAQAIAELYGVELVSLHRRDGWQLWESEGTTFDLYDYADYMDHHNDNLHRWDSYKEYADELREYANGGDMDEDMKQQFTDAADKVADWQLEPNEFIYCEQGYPYLTDPDKADRMVDHFSYDSHQYTLALDCRIDD